MVDFEKLGVFYLGRLQDRATGAPTDEPLLVDARDFTTHAVIIGMTGSGKTGLGVGLLEEAAIDGIPALVIDPKGDMANLALAFPELAAADFRPFVDEGAAEREGISADALAEKTAASWRAGLAEWGQDPARVARYREAARVAVFTPGSRAGIPVALLRSFAAQPGGADADPEDRRDRVTATVAGLLSLAGIAADPVRDREGILLSMILEGAWTQGRSLDLAALITAVQRPPFEQVGVIPLDAFFPDKERFALALALNNLLASPGFEAWREGVPLEIPRLLFTADGKPRLAVLSIAHLSESERMFFVTLLLNELVAWTRRQPGTTSLRALLYMDEVFGYFPPTANPPSKKPMLTLLKQARAFGVGVVLATQNPVDLDYKALANAGIWFVGRLQTDRDRERVLEGLEGAAASTGKGFDRARMAETMGALGKRVFLMSSIYEEGPFVFRTRWALSFLRGPMTRSEIQRLGERGLAGEPGAAEAPAPVAPPAGRSPGAAAPGAGGPRPVLPAGVAEIVLPAPAGGAGLFRPRLLGEARTHFVASKLGIDTWEKLAYLASLDAGADLDDPWEAAAPLDEAPGPGAPPPAGARFVAPPADAFEVRRLARWEKALEAHVYRTARLTLFVAPAFDTVGRPGESEAEFRARLALIARERRDAALDELQKRNAAKAERLESAVRRAEERHARESAQLRDRAVQTAVSTGTAIFGALFGRRRGATAVGRAVGGASRTAKERDDVVRAEQGLAEAREELARFEQDLRDEAARLALSFDPSNAEIGTETITPRKADTKATGIALAWQPAEP